MIAEWYASERTMRRLTLFLILGGLLAFLILEYYLQDQERRLKRRVRSVSPQGDVLQQEMATATSTRRQWQGTDDASAAKDDLTMISGIGPAFERALNAAGIHTFAQLAEQTPESLVSRMATRISAERIRRDRWIEQARELARSG
jgi:predicted flap endonuclease-1-like 5' DNA nuclease